MEHNFTKITIFHYLLGMVLLSVYGARVCPFLDSLNVFQLVIPIVIFFTIALFIRLQLQKNVDSLPLEKQIKAQFFLEFKVLSITGFALAISNIISYDFPLESSLKVIFGTMMLAIFIGIDQALVREHYTINEYVKKGVNVTVSQIFLSIPAKFIAMSIIMIGSITAILLMAIKKDLDWFHEEGIHLDFLKAQLSILGEISFIILIILAYSIRIILLFGNNLKILLKHQNEALQKVSHGDLNTHVPVVTYDEFGLMAEGTNTMITDLKKQQEKIQKTRDVVILGMASLAEARDNETGAHILRTQNYVKALALYLQSQGKYLSLLTNENIETLYKSAPMHDIGKVGIPDHILLKPGKLTEDEFAIMKQHAQIGADAIEHTKGELDCEDTFLNFAQEIANYHHEKYDGSGYPHGLKGDEIPLSARLMAVADVYDALISKRVYKEGFSHEKAKEIILEGRGTHFDPEIVDAFVAIEEEFVRIKEQFQ